MNFTEVASSKLNYWYDFLFSILNESKNDVCYDPSLCKEYTLDCIHSSIFTGQSIYSFDFKKTDLNNLNVVFSTSNNIDKIIDVCHKLEEKFKIKDKTKYYKIKDGWYCIQGSADWLIAPPLVSLYTLIIRSGVAYFKHDKQHIEPIWYDVSSALNHIINNGIEKIFGTRDKTKENWECISIHGQGIHNFATKLSILLKEKKDRLIVWDDIMLKVDKNKKIDERTAKFWHHE